MTQYGLVPAPEVVRDFHGFSREDALSELELALNREFMAGKRIICFITGMGNVTREAVGKALTSTPQHPLIDYTWVEPGRFTVRLVPLQKGDLD